MTNSASVRGRCTSTGSAARAAAGAGGGGGGAGVASTSLALLCLVSSVWARPESTPCNVRARTEAGWVCGLARWSEDGAVYASFRGVPYAKQPVGELRFKELEPPEPWDHLYDARREGPACEQTDVIYGPIMQPQGHSEACIHANIHVPIVALPGTQQRLVRELQAPYQEGLDDRDAELTEDKGLPIVVFIHGGGFMYGSGDADLHGPEYLVSKQVIVITFNYRLNVYGFLSLNSAEIPGNQGLRDMVTLLRWVKRNARAFGGDPGNVTLMGQSAGAVAAHLLTLSKATEGLYKRAFLMSGTAISTFLSTTPGFAQLISSLFLKMLNIKSTDTKEIHRQLVKMPVEKLNEANRILLDQFGLIAFTPTVESSFPGVTRVLDDDPEVLINSGRGKDVPIVMGFTNAECEVFRPRLEQFDIASKISINPTIRVPTSILYKTLPDLVPGLVQKIDSRYYNGSFTIDNFINFCTEAYYQYPALKMAKIRACQRGAPFFLYEFRYDGLQSVLKKALNLTYVGAAHIEDLTYMFRVNSMIGTHDSFPPKERDDNVKDWMTTFLTNFMRCSSPVCENKDSWPEMSSEHKEYQLVTWPEYRRHNFTDNQQDFVKFFDDLTPKTTTTSTT